MYNYFLIIGRVETVEKDTISVLSGTEHLEIITEFETPVMVGDMVAVKGTIKSDGLYAQKIAVVSNKEEFSS